MSYLRERLTLIFAHEIQADKKSFLKISTRYKSNLVVCFIEVCRSINNRRSH